MLSSHNLNFFLAILLQLLINYKGYDFPSIFKKMIMTAFLKVHVNVLLKRNNFNSKKTKFYFLLETPCKFPSDPLVSDADTVSPIPF